MRHIVTNVGGMVDGRWFWYVRVGDGFASRTVASGKMNSIAGAKYMVSLWLPVVVGP